MPNLWAVVTKENVKQVIWSPKYFKTELSSQIENNRLGYSSYNTSQIS